MNGLRWCRPLWIWNGNSISTLKCWIRPSHTVKCFFYLKKNVSKNQVQNWSYISLPKIHFVPHRDNRTLGVNGGTLSLYNQTQYLLLFVCSISLLDYMFFKRYYFIIFFEWWNSIISIGYKFSYFCWRFKIIMKFWRKVVENI